MNMPKSLSLRFFARLRDDLNTSEESLVLPEQVTTVEELKQYLCLRGDNWQAALNTPGLFAVVEQKVVDWDTPLEGHEEVAFFPPVTGG